MAVRCQRCGKEVSSGEVRYVSPSEFYCETCFLAHSGKARGQGDRAKGFDASPVKRVKLVCAKCGFETRFRENSDAKRVCSYCGSEDLQEGKDSAAQLIAEADEVDTRE